jgi:hypothetical protein
MNIKFLIPLLAFSIITGCRSEDELSAKKAKLAEMEKQYEDLGFQIRELRKEVLALDSTCRIGEPFCAPGLSNPRADNVCACPCFSWAGSK